jgi:SGNH domain (fused to AT3 domains)
MPPRPCTSDPRLPAEPLKRAVCGPSRVAARARRSSSLHWTLGVVAALCLHPAGAATASAQRSRVIVRVHPPYAVPVSLHAIACPTRDFCAAVDHAGDVLTANGPGATEWHATNVDAATNLTSIACASTSLCAATDQAGDVAISTMPAAVTSTWHVARADSASQVHGNLASVYLSSVSCPSNGLCVAVDNKNHVLATVNPTASRPHWEALTIQGAWFFVGVSCPTVALCVAVDLEGDVVWSTNPAADNAGTWSVQALPNRSLVRTFPDDLDGNFASGISCSSEALCAVTTKAGAVFTSTNPVGGAGTWASAQVDRQGSLDAISCTPQPAFCAAVDNRGYSFVSDNPPGGSGSWRALPRAGHASPASVACSAPEECAAVDFRGGILSLDHASAWRVQPSVNQPSSPACFGAAAVSAVGRCRRAPGWPRLLPTPSEAELTPNSYCAVVGHLQHPGTCVFGVPASAATATVALLGDSHAQHWRAALEVVAQERAWQAVSVTTSGCPFSAGRLSIAGPQGAACRRLMTRTVPAWLRTQPQISTVFVSESVMSVPRGSTADLSQAIAGYRRAWQTLPQSVRHLIVIRDTPHVGSGTLACVEGHRPLGTGACAVPRSQALEPDPAVLAARQLRSGRVQVIDLTRFMCGARSCPPVVGGALVYKDFQHLSEVFATTLGPYLGDAVGQLIAHWR